MRGLWRVLVGYRSLRLLLSAGLISLTGDWILRTGLAYAVYALTGSTLASAGALLASLVPQIALGPLAGVYVDRWDRRRTMIVTNLLSAAGLLPLLTVHSRHDVWVIYLVTVVQASLAQFFTAAEAAAIPGTVPGRDLVTANALNGQNRDIARLAGAALGGVTAGLGGIPALTLLDVASFAGAAALLALIRNIRAAPPAATQAAAPPASAQAAAPPDAAQVPAAGQASRLAAVPRVLRELTEGARVAARTPTLRLLLLFVLVTGVGEAVVGTLMAPFVRDVLYGSAAAYGLVLSSQALGGIAGGVAVAATGSRREPRRLLGYGALAFGLLDLVLFLYPLLTHTFWPAVALMVAIGMPTALMGAGLYTLFQTATGDAHRGRVFGLANAVEGAAMLAGALASGALGNRLGIVPVIATQGVAYCLAGTAMLLFLPRPARGAPAAPRQTATCTGSAESGRAPPASRRAGAGPRQRDH